MRPLYEVPPSRGFGGLWRPGRSSDRLVRLSRLALYSPRYQFAPFAAFIGTTLSIARASM
jgi:hypothetical protein